MANNPNNGFDYDELERILRDVFASSNNITASNNNSGSGTRSGYRRSSSSGSSEADKLREEIDNFNAVLSGLDAQIEALKKEVERKTKSLNLYAKDPAKRKEKEDIIKNLKQQIQDLQDQAAQTTKSKSEAKAKLASQKQFDERIDKILNQKRIFYDEAEKIRRKYIEKNITDYEKMYDVELKMAKRHAKEEEQIKKHTHINGKRHAAAELVEKSVKAISKIKDIWQGETFLRGVGHVAHGGAKFASGALNFIDSGKVDVSATTGKVSGALSQMGPYGAAAGAAVDIFAKLFEIFSKVDTAASKYARTVGGSRFTMMKMRSEAANLAASFSRLGGRTYDAAELLDTMAEYSLTLGRNLEYVSDSSIKAMKDLKDFGIGMDVLNQFDTFGLSVTAVSEKMGKLYAESGKKGLNAKAVSDAMTKNLKLAQTYTFQRGIKALETMAQKSASLKYNMEMASRFADKVSTLEGAVSAGARLSVLGGEFAKFGNPLQMLYGGLQDVEKLNDMLTGMTANLAYYDEKKKQFDISAGDRMRLREVASATGADYGELVTMAMQSGKRRKIDEQLMSSAGAGVKDEETRELIRNIAEFSGDTAYVKMQGETKKLSELTDRDKATLKREAEARANTNEQNIGDIMQNTRSIQERLDDIVKTLKAQIVKALFRLVGFGDKEYAASMGLSSKSAETYNRLSDDYYHGGMSVSGTKELSSLGFSQTEFAQIQKGEMSQTQFDTLLLNKLKEKEQNAASGSFSSGSAGGFATGGVVRGKGGPTSDAIRANVSNGEYIVNAKDAKENMQLLEGINQGKFSNGANPYKITKVERGGGTETYSQTPKSQTMSFEPLNINIGGRIEVATEKGSKYLTVEDILTPQVLNRLIKEIEVQTNYAFNRTKVNWKYGVG